MDGWSSDGWSSDGVNRIELEFEVSLLVVLSCMMVHQSFSVFSVRSNGQET